MPKFFGMPFKQLLEEKHPTAWVEFERDLIDEQQLFDKFFQDGRAFDGRGLVSAMVRGALQQLQRCRSGRTARLEEAGGRRAPASPARAPARGSCWPRPWPWR
jgi:hypothetical protein